MNETRQKRKSTQLTLMVTNLEWLDGMGGVARVGEGGGGVIEIPTEVSRPGERTDVEAIVSNETSSQQKKECYKTEE